MNIELPIVDPEATLEECADLLEGNNVSGAVIRGTHRIVTAQHLAAAAKQQRTVDQAESIQPKAVLATEPNFTLDKITVEVTDALFTALNLAPKLCRCNGAARHICGTPGPCPYIDGATCK